QNKLEETGFIKTILASQVNKQPGKISVSGILLFSVSLLSTESIPVGRPHLLSGPFSYVKVFGVLIVLQHSVKFKRRKPSEKLFFRHFSKFFFHQGNIGFKSFIGNIRLKKFIHVSI